MLRQIVFKILFLFFISTLFAEWNEDFERQTEEMCHIIPLFQSPKFHYYHDFFLAVRQQLAGDKKLLKAIAKSPINAKFNKKLSKYGIILKKRSQSNIKEVFTWEISLLLGSSNFVVPAYPMEMGNNKVVLQKIETFRSGHEKIGHQTRLQKKVPLISYWKAHIQAYLLGLGDLVARNIGVSPRGKIRFFDTESSFHYRDIPKRNEVSFLGGFLCESLDWPQYRTKLDKIEAAHLRRFMQTLKHREHDLLLYMAFRPFNIPEGLFARLKRLRSFSIQEGVTFRDLYGHLFPTLDPGLDKLNKLVRPLMKKKVDHGSSLLFVCRWIKHLKLTKKERAKLQDWIDTYVSK